MNGNYYLAQISKRIDECMAYRFLLVPVSIAVARSLAELAEFYTYAKKESKFGSSVNN
jgi:hypothetical protein